MREIKILAWCDLCWNEGMVHTEAIHTYTMGLVTGESRPALKLLEVCDTHNKTLADFQALLAEVGQTPEFKPKPTKVLPPDQVKFEQRRIPCPVCRVEVKASTMVQHIWSNHRTDARPPAPKICPDCREQIDSPQGMAQHRRVHHDYDAIANALSGVKGWKG